MAKWIDTNLVVRVLINDDPNQAQIVRRLIASEPHRLNTTVVLEAYWVMERVAKVDRRIILDGLQKLCALPTIVLDEPKRVSLALEWTRRGMSFADAVHLAAVQSDGILYSFDRNLRRKAAALGAPTVEAPG